MDPSPIRRIDETNKRIDETNRSLGEQIQGRPPSRQRDQCAYGHPFHVDHDHFGRHHRHPHRGNQT